ncbi:MAG TPA: DUF3888 domain-containing protein [Caproicibacter sp.]|nr:DUF3888 domain-containing protein [Caproicibacter sp.]
MKKAVLSALAITVALSCLIFPVYKVSALTNNNGEITESAEDKTYQKLIVDLLFPKIDEPSDLFYKKYLKEPPTNAPYLTTVLSVTPQKSEKNFEDPSSFLVKVQISPYYGPHNSVGTDNITFQISSIGEIKPVIFEHVESYEIQPNYKDEIISWPPPNGSFSLQ